jgi:DNA repair photolyase
MTTKGTKEWADWNFNLYQGCSNACLYCYAKRMAMRFSRITVESNWEMMVFRPEVLNHQFRKRSGRGMFPTSHDITDDPLVLKNCLSALILLLKAGNNILITSKPREIAIKTIVETIQNQFPQFKDQVQFRFTVDRQ